MPEILTESFCERCGTRYTFESVAPRVKPLTSLKILGKGLRNYVLSDETSMHEALADARSDAERELSGHQLDAFHKTFNFCMSCRQYTCSNCWNEPEGRCLTCAPHLGTEIMQPPFAEPADVVARLRGEAMGEPIGPVALTETAEAELRPTIEASEWPTIDLELRLAGRPAQAATSQAAELLSSAEPEAAEVRAQPIAAEPEAVAQLAAEPEADGDVARLAAEPDAAEVEAQPIALEPEFGEVEAQPITLEPQAVPHPVALEPADALPVAAAAAVEPVEEPALAATEVRAELEGEEGGSTLAEKVGLLEREPGPELTPPEAPLEWAAAGAPAVTVPEVPLLEPAVDLAASDAPTSVTPGAARAEGADATGLEPAKARTRDLFARFRPKPRPAPSVDGWQPAATPAAAALEPTGPQAGAPAEAVREDVQTVGEPRHAAASAEPVAAAGFREPAGIAMTLEAADGIEVAEAIEQAPAAAVTAGVASPPVEAPVAAAEPAEEGAPELLASAPVAAAEPVEEGAPELLASAPVAAAQEQPAALVAELAAAAPVAAGDERAALALEPSAEAVPPVAAAEPVDAQHAAAIAEVMAPEPVSLPAPPAPRAAPQGDELPPPVSPPSPWRIVAEERPTEAPPERARAPFAPPPGSPPRRPTSAPTPWPMQVQPPSPAAREPVSQPPAAQSPAAGWSAQPDWSPRAEWPPVQVAPAAPAGGVWAESSRDVLNKAATGVQACVSCGLPLSASARFCRRCGTRQG